MTIRPERAYLAFGLAFFVFHQIGSVLANKQYEAAIDVLTPFVVTATTVALLKAYGLPRRAAWIALVAGVLYVHGHGAHLAANSIHNDGLDNSVVYFWDERFGHIGPLLGWLGLLAAACIAERDAPQPIGSLRVLGLGVVVLGWTFFTSTVEGQTWWMELPAAVVFTVWAARERRPLLIAAAATLVIGALLIGVWAIMNGGVPEFSDL